MPRVRTLDPIKFKLNHVMDYIRGEMKRMQITQKEIAERLNITESTASKKFNKGEFTMYELIQIATILHLDWSRIGDLAS